MIPVTDLRALRQSSGYVELFEIDATAIGGSITRVTNDIPGGTSVALNTKTYSAFPVKGEGFDYTGDGSNPNPKLTVANVTRALIQDVINLGDLVGAKVTRIRTLEKYLDGGSSPNPSNSITDVYYIEQKTLENSTTIQFSLRSPFDLGDRKIGRVVTNKDFPAVGIMRPYR